MNGRLLVTFLIGVLVLALGAIFWLGLTGGGRASEAGRAQSAVPRNRAAAEAPSPAPPASGEPAESAP